MKRYFALFGLAALVSGVLIVRNPSQAEPPSSPVLPASFAAPSAQSIDSSVGHVVLSLCQIKLLDEVQLAADQAGVLDFVVAEGQVVRRGETVAHTRDELVKASLAVASRQSKNDVEVRYARKASELAQVEYERDLQANSVVPLTVSDLTIRSHRLAAEKALLQLEQAETALEIEKLRLNETEELLMTHRVLAPMDAVVRTVFKRRGESVGEGEPIVELVNTSRVKVEGYVPLADLDSVRVGSLVSVQLDVPDVALPSERLSFPGRIAFVDVKVEPVSRGVKVWAEVNNINTVLKEGLPARMLIDRHRVDQEYAASRGSVMGQEPSGQGSRVKGQGPEKYKPHDFKHQ